ncbi:helicase C-terminal domain-containing protein [Haloarchaeobius iranensis]|uniref:Rad3-related DNA helicase n=1 Tax=Haloarchaeobius iranensis TaxID=996166 RepID=A0A1G9S9M6_9EURY|nr:ATP-dependent DNA helicase [Haloarchaeobius iranensis]SDM32040.1 Rad3-related DNA helicase [Haloarchaeobius iranensis]
MDPSRIFEEFPAPSYRGAQEQALRDIQRAFDAGNEVVLVRAPTGSGKSLLARAIAGCAAAVDEVAPSEASGAYYTTPQVSQLDDVAADSLLEDLNVIRGKSNYDCILPGERDTPVNRAPCVRESGYDCSVRHRCPYFSDRAIASNREIAAMTLAYFMQTAGSEVFRTRDVVVVDEAHGLAEWAEMYATIELSPQTLPNWDDLRVPEVDSPDRAVDYADALLGTLKRRKDELLGRPELSAAEVSLRDRLQERIGELDWFVSDYRDPESATEWLVDQEPDDGSNDGDGGPLTIKPMNPEKYLKHTVWDRGNRFALLSATILNKDAFCRQVGLPPERTALVDVEHTFPVEHRPLYDVTQGKMTYEHRDETLPKVARVVTRVMQHHPGEKGLVHCHSYGIQERLAELLRDFGVGARVRTHSRDNRDGELDSWKATDEPEVFLSVKMEEALDLKGDLCRWQVLCKAPFLNTGDSRVAHRLEQGQWAWYYRSALRTVIQACGRVVRAPDDWGHTYLADSSLVDLFDRARSDTPPWFTEQVTRLSTPDLPTFDPSAALAEMDEGAAAGRRYQRGSGSESNGGDGGSSGSGGGSGYSRSRSGRSGRSGSSKSPMADVWDTDG